MARRENSARRRGTPFRTSASRVLVVCCGQTEQAYPDGVKRLSEPVTVKAVVEVGSPEQLVRHAVKPRQNDRDGFDEYWCVVDVDEFDIDAAVAAAEVAGISLAVSNPCFEVWLTLHFADCTAGIASPKAAADKLRKHMPGYAKGTLDFAALAGTVQKAVERAKALKAGNPSTDVWRLAEVLLQH
ncbi:RloB family protein [Lentzea sp.]|uniref:RloB family protein n=1 Tax=Lentzea sp. TaxID=56099 RepID=UPI002BB5960E|nr:RloB family protein [Lentzea sp.]HUQ55387.1 RloB family protein [Lentzea sp.]